MVMLKHIIYKLPAGKKIFCKKAISRIVRLQLPTHFRVSPDLQI